MAKVILVAFNVAISAVVLGATSHPIAKKTLGSCVRHGVMTSQPVITDRWSASRGAHDEIYGANGGGRSKVVVSRETTGTQTQEIHSLAASPGDRDSPLERALARFGAAIEARLLLNESGSQVPATRSAPEGLSAGGWKSLN